MNKENIILNILNYLQIADAKTIGDICYAQGFWGSPHSSRVQVQKHLNNLVDLGKIDRYEGCYRTISCKSEYGDHARLLTEALAEILKLPLTTTIYRESSIPIGFRADALILCRRENKGICFVLEVAHTETHDYLKRKVDAWRNWKETKQFLTQTFGIPIKNYGFVTAGKEVNGAVPFRQLLAMLGAKNA